ncbi:MAG: ribosomal protein S18-alanine N-acetyltransferase [Gemmatimonadota bacterium]|nr:ribosomal protein S18-alanine N-acetyltransferase [Gemmatimonadota bacterium]
MRSADLPQILEIENASFATPWSPKTFLNLLRRPNAALFTAEYVPGDVVGYAVIWFAGPEGELGDLAVRAEGRRRGVGSALVEAALSEAARRASQEVYLEVRESNLAARNLYERHGFEVVNRRTGYYSDPVEDALVMRRFVPTAGATGSN